MLQTGTHQFDLFCTSTNRLLRPKPYFDFFGQTLLRPLYFDWNCTSTCTSRPIRSSHLTKGWSTEIEVKRSKYGSRSREVEVERSKYRKGRTDAYPCKRLKQKWPLIKNNSKAFVKLNIIINNHRNIVI